MFIGLAGGVAGLALGLVTARLVAANWAPGFLWELGGALGVTLVIAGISAGLCRWLADVPPEIDGRQLNLEVEFRFPAATNSAKPPTAAGDWKFSLGSLAGHRQRGSQMGKVMTDIARFDAGRWIVPAEVFLFTERGRWTILLQSGDKDVAAFLVSLPARPGKSFEQWSEWLPRQLADGQPWPTDKMSYRLRVQQQAPPPSPSSNYEKTMTEAAAREEAEFATIPADAPVERWLPFLYKDGQKSRAMASITNRPNLAQELTGLAVGEDANLAAEALRFMEKHPSPTSELVAPVRAAGRDIAERIRKVNAIPAGEDPSYQHAAYVGIRFNGWMTAVFALREKCNADFTPELKAILELSRAHPDSQVMQVDICRVASFYLKEWAGIAPLASDPQSR
jgi:hypothetical protein